jgi:hypothetical protein
VGRARSICRTTGATGAGHRHASRRYVRVALEAEAETVAAAPEGSRNVTLSRSAFSLGTLAGTGALDPDVVIDSLYSAALQAGLPKHEARTTTERQVRAGMKHPRSRGAA